MTERLVGKTSVQFHAVPAELISFAADMIRDAPVHATAFFVDGSTATLGRSSMDRLTRNMDAPKAVALTALQPSIGFNTIHQFHKLNPDTLVLQFGRLGQSGLEESWLWATALSNESLARWKRIVSQLKKITVAGAVAENTQTGQTSSLRSHRLSPKAVQLHNEGTHLLSVAPNVRIHPNKSTSANLAESAGPREDGDRARGNG